MAKKKAEKPATKKTYKILVGCNTSDNQRFEAGEKVMAEELKTKDEKALLELSAIEEIK